MSGLELIARLADALAWPLAAVIAVIVLRRSIAQLISRRPPRRVKAGPFEVEWDRLLAETEKEVEAERLRPADARLQAPNVTEELAPTAQTNPLAAVREAYIAVERELRRIVGPDDEVDKLGAVALARRAEREKRVNPETARAVEGLSVMRNLAVHGGTDQITLERANEFLALTDAVLFALRNRPHKAD